MIPAIVFDECFPPAAVSKIVDFLASSTIDQPELFHLGDERLGDEFGLGMLDEEWLPAVAERGWAIVTQDRGKGGRSKGGRNIGSPLPALCEALGIRHVLLSGKVCELKVPEKAQAVLAVWNGIRSLDSFPAGTRRVLIKASKETSAGFSLREVARNSSSPKRTRRRDSRKRSG